MVVCFFLRKRHVKKNKEETEQKPKKTLIELFFYVFMVSLMFFQLARRAQIQFVELTLNIKIFLRSYLCQIMLMRFVMAMLYLL